MTLDYFDKKCSKSFDEIVLFFNSKIKQTFDNLTRIIDFYNIENLSALETEIPELKFVYSGAELNLKVLLSYENGVDETNIDYGILIDEPYIENNFEFETSKEEDDFYDSIWKLKITILHIFISYIWQEFDFNSCGLKVNISDGQCSDFFYLNNFKWKDKYFTIDYEKNDNFFNLKNKNFSVMTIYSKLKINNHIIY